MILFYLTHAQLMQRTCARRAGSVWSFELQVCVYNIYSYKRQIKIEVVIELVIEIEQ